MLQNRLPSLAIRFGKLRANLIRIPAHPPSAKTRMFGWSTTGLSTKANMLHFKTRSLEINPAYMAVRLMKALRRARSGVGWLASRLISSLRCEGFACWLVASLRSTARARNLLFLLVMFAVQAGFSGPPSPTGYGVTKFTRKARKFWWRQTGSNRRPQACKASALPTELCPRCYR